MKEELLRFFRPINPDLHIEDSDYAQLQVCVSMAEAMARSTNSSLYIIDYNRKNFLYVSPNPLFLCGYSSDEVRKKGYAFYIDVVPAEEIQMLFAFTLSAMQNAYSSLVFQFNHDLLDNIVYKGIPKKTETLFQKGVKK